MGRDRTAVLVVLIAAAMIGSVVALPLLGGGLGPIGADDEDTDAAAAALTEDGSQATLQENGSQQGTQPAADSDFELVSLESPSMDGESTGADGTNEQVATQGDREDAVETGVDEGIALVQSQGVEVTQEQRAAALEGAQESAAQYQTVEAEQVQAATKGAVHGALIQEQSANVTQIQYAVGGATGGGLSQSQSVNATQLQSATWGAAHGAVAQSQRVSVEQLQVATSGAAAGAASEAGANDIGTVAKIQEAAQGSAYGVLTQYQSIAVEQRQRVTLEHVQNAAAGAAAGSLEGSANAVLEQEQRVEAEQRQRVTIKQIQKAAAGAAKGALVQEQAVSVEQTQATARGASRGSLKQIQSVSIEQIQRISITQVQEASFGAAKGAISQSQEATVEQIQAAADGGAGGALVQRQTVSVTQVQSAATGAAQGAVTSGIQRQEVTVEQVQAAAFGASEGAVSQTQIIDVTQVQRLASGGASGALVQSQEASITQIQTAARSACEETAQAVQSQRISITQLQSVTAETAADATAYAIQENTDDVTLISQYVEVEVVQRIETIDRIEGEAAIDVADQTSDGEQVTIEDVSLSEGGFVAVYSGVAVDADPDDVVGVSSYLEAGEHENVTVDLDEPLNESGPLVAVAHHDTNDDETFDYVDSDGEDDVPYVTGNGAPVLDAAFVTVTDETNDTDTVDSAPEAEGMLTAVDYNIDVAEENSTEEYVVLENTGNRTLDFSGWTLQDRIDEGVVDGAGYDPLSFPEDFTLGPSESVTVITGPGENTEDTLHWDIETPVWNASGDDVVVLDGDGTVVLEQSIGEEQPNESEATLSVDDQEGDGETLEIDAASASVPYVVTAEYDGERVDSEQFEANETVAEERLDLEPPLEENATVNVSVRAAADDAALANESIEYAVVEPEPGEPTANLSVADQTGDGETLTVTSANASVEYALTITDGNGTQLAESESFAANETIGPTEFDLEPPLEANSTLNVSVVAAEDGTALETDSVEYTVDGELADFDVEFTSCSRAVVDASLEDGDQVAASTGFYDQAGFGDTIIEDYVAIGEDVEAPFNGTIVFEIGDERNVTTDGDEVTVEVPDYGTFGTYLSGISSPEAVPFASIDYANPDMRTCAEEARPDLPSLSVEETTPVDGGDAINVTFGYENPNNETMSGNSEFVEGTTTDEPPTELAPGENEFTVEWTPESDDERLVWQADFANYGYDEPVTAATPTAGEIQPADPAAFNVSITETNSPVEQGEQLAVEADVQNTGGDAGTQNVSLAVGETAVDSESVSLEAGENQTVSFTAETDDLEPGEYPLEVATDNETAEGTVTIEESGDPATFDVSIAGTNSPVEQGEPVTVEADLENVGDEAGTQDIEIAVGGGPGESVPVTLEPGEIQTATLSYETGDLEPGEYPLAVSSENETAETTVTVEESGEPATFAVTDIAAPETGDPGEEATVTATVENQGDLEGTQTVTYSVDGQPIAEETVTLAGGQSAEIQFSSPLPEGTSTHTIATDDEQASVTIEATAPATAETDGTAEPGDGTETGETDEPAEPTEPAPPAEQPDGSEPTDEPPAESAQSDDPGADNEADTAPGESEPTETPDGGDEGAADPPAEDAPGEQPAETTDAPETDGTASGADGESAGPAEGSTDTGNETAGAG
ncbi:DUF7282 domain-containing protein [Natrinema versiforme]|uniref:LTD domain-containing protein n=1 Tax=Natrinema versiforme JCM 10478 TaxID=1227496 RepID=L9Y0M6_9EURY|nr:lamin tail domain-containing protein [Natrinema versiforme]ELY67639.1 hypothetical protein C489_09912 [Natrinema versiforme JCM 10478]